MKRILSFFMVFVLVFGQALSVHADEETVLEIKVILNEGLLAKNDMLEYGDAQGLEDMIEGWNMNFKFIAGFTEDLEKGAELEPEEIDYGGIDVWCPGTYTVTVRLKICEDYAKDFIISDEVRTLVFQVTVGALDKITMAYNQVTDTFIQYDFTAPKETAPVLWYAKTEPGKLPEDMDWEEGDEEFYRRSPPMVRILRSALDEHCDYFFQMRSEKLASNILKLEYSSLFPADNKDMGGDRDGNDNDDDSVKPPFTQPSPLPPDDESQSIGSGEDMDTLGAVSPSGASRPDKEPPRILRPDKEPPVTTPSQVTSPAMSSSKAASRQENEDGSIAAGSRKESLRQGFESVDGDTMTVSGARIMWLLCGNAETVPFGWNSVSLEIPALFLEGLGLSSEDLFALTLTREEGLSFRIALKAKGEEIQSLGATVVRMPVPKPQNGFSLALNGKIVDTPVAYEQGCAVFTINQAGRYELCEGRGSLETSAPNRTEKLKTQTKAIPGPDIKDFLPFFIGCLLLIVWGGRFLMVKCR